MCESQFLKCTPHASEQLEGNQQLRFSALVLFVRFQDIGCFLVGHIDP
jgi:hypothetical protein